MIVPNYKLFFLLDLILFVAEIFLKRFFNTISKFWLHEVVSLSKQKTLDLSHKIQMLQL